jgi:putative heme iron utilization protein
LAQAVPEEPTLLVMEMAEQVQLLVLALVQELAAAAVQVAS